VINALAIPDRDPKRIGQWLERVLQRQEKEVLGGLSGFQGKPYQNVSRETFLSD